MRRNILSYRQNVKSKAGKVYRYRQYDPQTKRIRVEVGYGFKDGSLQKLSFKNGNLTKAGEEFRKGLEEAVYESQAQKDYTINQFDEYVATMKKRKQVVTPASFESHMKNEDYDRMLYNMNIDKQDIYNKIKNLKMEDLSERQRDLLNEHGVNGVVNDYLYLSQFIEFNYTEGWSLKIGK